MRYLYTPTNMAEMNTTGKIKYWGAVCEDLATQSSTNVRFLRDRFRVLPMNSKY